MATDAAILFPNREVAIGEEKIKVTELAWPDALAFLRELGTYIGKLIDEKGEVRMDVGMLTELVMGTESLSALLLEKTTGRDAKSFPLSHALDVLKVAIELNVTPEIIARGKALAGSLSKLTELVPKMPAKSAKPTSSLSNTATPART
jgi:hypothetical protein